MSSLSDLDLIFVVPFSTVIKSLYFFRGRGEQGREAVVLWPGRVADGICTIVDALIPAQVAGRLFYRIPTEEVFRIIAYTSERELVIPIQIHSHPEEAFHSAADDELAFVQHENAISIVVPNFGDFADTMFLQYAKFYRLGEGSKWLEISNERVATIFRFEHL